MQKIVGKYELPKPDTSIQTKDVTLKEFWLRLYTPPGATGSEPVGVYFHGGGWAMGNVEQEDAICRLISKHHRMTVVSVEYRLAPEHKYPAALDDCVDATTWSLSTFPVQSVTLIGSSAGGNLAFGTALRLIDRGKGAQVDGVVALVPVTIHPRAVPADMKARYTSYETNAETTVNTQSAMDTFLDTYGAPPDDKYTSCLLHPKLSGLRKVYMTESGADTLRDDARLMKEALEKAGVSVTYDAYPGYPHYSWTFPAKCLEQHQKEFFGNVLNGIQWVRSP